MALHRVAVLVPVIAVAFACTERGTTEPAPLPPGIASTGHTSVGIFMSATLRTSEASDPEVKKLYDAEKDCVRRGMKLQIEGERASYGRKSLWLYLTADQAVEFAEMSRSKIDSEHCVATVEPGERTIQQRPRNKSDGIEGVFGPFEWYKTIPSCRKDKGCERTNMAGVTAQCYNHSSLFFYEEQCLSVAPGPTRGYLLLDESQDDTLQGSAFEVTAIDENAEIDNAIFDWQPDWARNSR